MNVVGYTGSDLYGEMVVPRPCGDCHGSGRILTTGWSAVPDPGDTA